LQRDRTLLRLGLRPPLRERPDSVRKCPILSAVERFLLANRRRWMTRTMCNLKNCEKCTGTSARISSAQRPAPRPAQRTFSSMFAKARCARTELMLGKGLASNRISARARTWGGFERFVSYPSPQPVGTRPATVGEHGQTTIMPSSPIHLPDFPQIALESRGSLFEIFEIDEKLTLRIQAVTKEHGTSAAAIDGGGRELLARTGSRACRDLHFEERTYIAVILDDDPGKDSGALRRPGHRFFFSPEEVEPFHEKETRMSQPSN